MRGSKTWLALALLLVGCASELESPTEGDAEATEQTHERLQVEVAPTPTQEATSPGAPVNPDTVVVAGPGGKPQPDPWRVALPTDPNKPQPDPWAPVQKNQSQTVR